MNTTLNNGIEMPMLGLGVYDMHNDEAINAVEHALKTGYRLIDTASMYGNEEQVGIAVRNSRIPRQDIFVTTKVNNTDQGYDSTLRAFEKSMKKLDIGHIDLYLVHWPIRHKRKETWKALEHLYDQKMVRAIGVANYLLPFLDELESYANIVPAVDQVEFSPWLHLDALLAHTKNKGIVLQSYTPLARGKKFDDPRIQQLCAKYNKTPSQVILRWNLQLGVSTIPKSSNPKRIEENFHVFDFEISGEDMKLLNNMNENFRVVDDPMEIF
ncbi:MAG TPA: aldo/keto reductase [Chitinophagaceae bacterium]|nr:aldo/keto reductase [Chitinophagaceae bacterium]